MKQVLDASVSNRGSNEHQSNEEHEIATELSLGQMTHSSLSTFLFSKLNLEVRYGTSR